MPDLLSAVVLYVGFLVLSDYAKGAAERAAGGFVQPGLELLERGGFLLRRGVAAGGLGGALVADHRGGGVGGQRRVNHPRTGRRGWRSGLGRLLFRGRF